MPPLFKLAIGAATDTTTTIDPTVVNLFYIFAPADATDGVLHAPAEKFVDDDNNPVTQLTLANPNNGYYLLVINGMLQQSSVYTVSASELVVAGADEILTGSPVVLTVTNFAPLSTSVTAVET